MFFRNTFFYLLLFLAPLVGSAQEKYFTKTGRISFYSHAPLEDIEAVNKTAGAILDTKTGTVQAVVLMRGFEFKKALMQEHFNENYVESHKYPKAELKGTITNLQDIQFTRNDSYQATIKGNLTMHGVTKDVSFLATLKIQDGKIEATSEFQILLSDYKISIPSLVKDKVSNKVKVTVIAKLEPLKL